MDNDIKTWLFDILQAISDIESFFENKPKQFEKYVSDLKTKRAVERELEIIGEAFNRILKNDPSFQIENIHKIIGTRNRIIHGYDSVSDDLIWSIVINHIPLLKKEVETKLEKI
jgi:uncharacterized protein with HEPN domain